MVTEGRNGDGLYNEVDGCGVRGHGMGGNNRGECRR